MPDVTVATDAELISELLSREPERIVLTVEDSPVDQNPPITPAISASIEGRRAVSLLQSLAGRIENDPPSYPTYLQ
jgi:hypothetical protein